VIAKTDPLVREFNGEFYAPCWLDRNTCGGLLDYYSGNHGTWGAQFRFVNIKDIDRIVDYYRTFNRGYELHSGCLTERWLDMLWNDSITKSRVDTLGLQSRVITACVSNTGIELINKMINNETERRNVSVDVLCFHSVGAFLGDPKDIPTIRKKINQRIV